MSINNPEQNQQSGITPEQMPPLGPTAEVPPIHSDKLNDPAYWNQKLEGESARVPREHRDDKNEKKGLSTRAKISIGGLALTIIPALGAGLWMKKQMNDVEESMLGGSDRPSASAPAVPGNEVAGKEIAPENNSPEYRFTLDQVTLTDAEVATLEAGDSEASHKILDTKLIPKLQEAVDEIHKNTKKGAEPLEGLDLANLAASEKALLTLGSINEKVPIEICHTTPNVDGSLNFCSPDGYSTIEIGKPINFAWATMDDWKTHKWQTEIHAEITDGNQLVLTSKD